MTAKFEGSDKIPKDFVFDTVCEKKLIYDETKNTYLNEIDEMLTRNSDIFHSSISHKLNSKLKFLHTFRKMQYGAYLIVTFVPLVYFGFAFYLVVKPFDTMKTTDDDGNIDVIRFNTGALIFGALLQMAM